MTPAEKAEMVTVDREVERFAMDADLTVYWPWVRPCWEASDG